MFPNFPRLASVTLKSTYILTTKKKVLAFEILIDDEKKQFEKVSPLSEVTPSYDTASLSTLTVNKSVFGTPIAQLVEVISCVNELD